MKIFALIILTCVSLLLCSSTPIGGDDHDIIAFKIINLTNRLKENTIIELQSYALSLEDYARHGKQIKGGIHDYVHKMPREDLIKYILTVCQKNQELFEEEKFNSIVQGRTEKVFLAVEEPIPAIGKLGGIHDYIYRVDNDTLIRWALTAQAHHNKITNQQDTLNVDKMSVKELIDFTLGMVSKYPGLDSSTELDRLGEQYKIATKPFSFGGIHDYLFRQSRSTLIRWALTGEAHERKVKGIQLLGGLEDYIDTLSDVEIANYVAEKAKNYKDLDSGDKLDSLAKAYSITHEPQPHLLQMGGLHDYIFRKDRKTLIIWALNCDNHDRYERKLNVLGGLHEMVHTMTNEKIAEYVLGVAAVYPVLNNAENLDALAKKYEIKYDFVDTLKFLQ